MNENRLNDDILNNITGGNEEPEEFDWRDKGYITPVKEKTENDHEWQFEAIGDLDSYTKVTGGSKADSDIEIAKTEQLIRLLLQSQEKTYESVINVIIEILKTLGKKPAIDMVEKLFANDENTRDELISIINESYNN